MRSFLIVYSYLSSDHFDIITNIRSEIISAQNNESRRRIVGWLSKGVPSPSKEHNLAREKHEETTGSWLIESDDFKNWLSQPNSFLWLNGGGKFCNPWLSASIDSGCSWSRKVNFMVCVLHISQRIATYKSLAKESNSSTIVDHL